MIVRRLPDSELELYHHGIMGMRWGVRRFQNRDGTLTSAGRKRRGLVEQIKYNRKMKKVRKAKVEKAKAQQKQKEEQAERLRKMAAERKERAEVIKTGNAKDIQKFQHKMSDKEYERALNRINLNQRLNDAVAAQSEAKNKRLQARINTITSTAKTIADVADSAGRVYDTLTKVGVIKKSDTTSALDKKLNKLEKESKIAKAEAEIDKNKEMVKMLKSLSAEEKKQTLFNLNKKEKDKEKDN